MKWLYLTIAIAAEVIATSTLKASDGFSNILYSIITLIGYIIAFYFLSLTLESIPLGLVYALWSGVGIVFITLIGVFMFKQTIDFPAIIGIALIVCGVIVINVFSKSLSH